MSESEIAALLWGVGNVSFTLTFTLTCTVTLNLALTFALTKSSGEIWLPECGLAKDGVWNCAVTAHMLIAWSGFEDHGSGVRWYDVCTGTTPSACDPEALILRSRTAVCLKAAPRSPFRDDRHSDSLSA